MAHGFSGAGRGSGQHGRGATALLGIVWWAWWKYAAVTRNISVFGAARET